MSNYVPATNFAAKDSLITSNPAKIIKGAEIYDEFLAIAIAIGTKPDSNSPTLTGIPLAPTANAGTNTTQIATTAFVTTGITAATGSLGTMSTQNKTAVDITGGTITGVAITGITDLTVADGGTGLSTLTSKNLLVGNGTSSPTFIAPGTSGNLLASNGTDWVSTAPVGAIGVGQTWQTFTTTTRAYGTTYTNSTGKPIQVLHGYGRNESANVTVGGVVMSSLTHDNNNNTCQHTTFIVPSGATYVINGAYSSDSCGFYWSELR